MLSVLPRDTSACGQGAEGIEPPTIFLVDDLLSLLSHLSIKDVTAIKESTFIKVKSVNSTTGTSNWYFHKWECCYAFMYNKWRKIIIFCQFMRTSLTFLPPAPTYKIPQCAIVKIHFDSLHIQVPRKWQCLILCVTPGVCGYLMSAGVTCAVKCKRMRCRARRQSLPPVTTDTNTQSHVHAVQSRGVFAAWWAASANASWGCWIRDIISDPPRLPVSCQEEKAACVLCPDQAAWKGFLLEFYICIMFVFFLLFLIFFFFCSNKKLLVRD